MDDPRVTVDETELDVGAAEVDACIKLFCHGGKLCR